MQDVFLVLVEKLPAFRYDPAQHFRGWLWTVTLERVARRRPGPHKVGGSDLDAMMGPDTPAALDEVEYRQWLTRRALRLIEDEFQGPTWLASREHVVAARPGAEVARDLGMTENAVYLAKGRVLRRLRRELDGLLD